MWILELIAAAVVAKMFISVLKDDSPDTFNPRKTLDKDKADEWNREHPDDTVEV